MLKRPFSNVRHYFCQTLGNTYAKHWKNTFAKRWKNTFAKGLETPWQNIGQYPAHSRIAP